MTAAATKRKPEITTFQIRELALAALVDERTLRRALSGRTLKSPTRGRIRRVLEERGLLELLPPPAAADGAR